MNKKIIIVAILIILAIVFFYPKNAGNGNYVLDSWEKKSCFGFEQIQPTSKSTYDIICYGIMYGDSTALSSEGPLIRQDLE